MTDFKYKYFYKITNNINGCFYYGIHSTNDLDDGYMGSGKRLKKAYKKYGVENFTKEILKYFDTLKELNDYEAEIVNEEMINNPCCYNMSLGGYYMSNESLYKLKNKIKIIEHQKGEKNSQYGKCWITKDKISIIIKKDEFQKYEELGWSRGRVIRNKGKLLISNKDRIWIHLKDDIKHIKKDEFQKYEELGWSRGKKDKIHIQKNATKSYSMKNRVVVVDKEGNRFTVSKDDPRYISGELVSFNKGKVTVIDKEGNRFTVSKDDPRYISGELTCIKKNHKKGLITAKDKFGNIFSTTKDDPRYISGELVGVNKGRHWKQKGPNKSGMYIRKHK